LCPAAQRQDTTPIICVNLRNLRIKNADKKKKGTAPWHG
jgi:hypothetical protein